MQRDEIVEKLKDAALMAYDLSESHDMGAKRQQEWMGLAAQVANMRCETCACRESDAGFCGELEVVVLNGFGCFNWESKK